MRKIHFIGIGGIGMSALARYYKSEGFEVSGSDNNKSEITDGLESDGIKVNTGTSAENIPKNVEKIIYTIAVTDENKELQKAKEILSHNSTLLTYPEALGEMTKSKNVIAVCGTHGKTTTTAMVYYALKNAGVNISMIVGSLIEVDGKKTNYIPPYRTGDNKDWIVIEACEFKRSFLNYKPNIILLTNIDNDHMDYFKDMGDVKSAFQEFVDKIKSPQSSLTGGVKSTSALVLHKAEDFLKINNQEIQKIVCEKIISENDMVLSVPGKHNRKNAQLVVALGEVLKLDKNKILVGLKNFQGTWRRQEFKGEQGGVLFYDDYAHHPTEIKATLQAFREKFPSKRIMAIFQPHLFSRTKLLFTDFVNSFIDADEVIVLPIYASREKFDDTINSAMICESLNKINKKNISLKKEEVSGYINSISVEQKRDLVIITLGAGDIYEIYKTLNLKKSLV